MGRAVVSIRCESLYNVSVQAQDPPKVQVVGAKGLYTLTASDPDAPSPDVSCRCGSAYACHEYPYAHFLSGDSLSPCLCRTPSFASSCTGGSICNAMSAFDSSYASMHLAMQATTAVLPATGW